ncbi:MAG: hypothetical protein HQK62_04960 [Desulfamplus sp.]|nr:hypothetical protein [Desulfamplus sp.]
MQTTITSVDATAEIFCTAFNALSKKEKRAVINKLFQHKEFYEDFIDISIMEQRKNEPSRSLDSYLAERKKKI